MIDPTSLTLFITAALLLLLAPGPAVLYIVARSIEQGRAAGMVSVLGIGIGSLTHIALAALGLSALLLASSLAFTLVKFAGAAYLVWMGVRSLLSRDREAVDGPAAPPSAGLTRIFWQGAVVNVLNPKTALFFLAFLPQFVDPARGPVALQILLLGAIFTGLAVASDSLYALAAGSLGAALRKRRGLQRLQRRLSGLVMVVLGVGAALAGDPVER
jgi:threonine/homoserine/homoserine lactone efflux protein